MLSITDAGLQVVRDRRGARTEQIARALATGFTPEELAQLRAVTHCWSGWRSACDRGERPGERTPGRQLQVGRAGE